MNFVVPAGHMVKLKESDQYSDLAREMKTKQTMELERDADTNSNRCAQNSQQRIGKRTGAIGNKTRVETIQITTLLISARIPRRVLET